jgi:26S proteasome regulatory subunit N9
LSPADRIAQAHDLSVAALLGETVYNFGELLMHPVLESIATETQFGYLVATLQAFNAGDHVQFEKLLPALSSNPILATRIDFLRQKMCLMALVECVFLALKSSRTIPFALISEASRVPLGEVEFLLIKALSLGLIRGTIDELSQALSVEWVQPRVLDRRQLVDLRAAIQAWKARITSVSTNMDLINSLPTVMDEA